MNPSSAVLNAVKGLTFAAGIFIGLLGALAGASYLVQLFFSLDGVPLDSAVAAVSAVVLGVGLGGALAWQGSTSLRDKPSALFRPPPVLLLILLYIPVVIIGQILISFDLFPVVTFPLFHIAAAALPPFAILAFTGRAFSEANLRWRELILQLSGGAFLATAVAFLAEILIGGLLLVGVFLVTAFTPAGQALIEELVANLEDPLWLQDPGNVQDLLLQPPVFITLALVFIIAAPMIEELVKLLGVTLMSYRRPVQVQAFVWGLAGGAGFALVENFFNTLLALEAWAFVILLRIGGTAMHSLGTGLTALGWHSLLAERRPWKLLGAYAVSVAIHALWNGAVIGMVGISVFAAGATGQFTAVLVGTGVALMLGLLVVLTLVVIVALVVITRRLQARLAASHRNKVLN